MSDLTRERGAVYGHPREHFKRTCLLLAIVFGDKPMCDLTPKDWAVVMMCDKLARLANTLDHRDSVDDIGGYAECWRVLDDEGR